MNTVTRSKKGGVTPRKVVRAERRPIYKQTSKTLSKERRQSARFTPGILVETFGLGDERTRTNIPDTTIQQFVNKNILVDKPAVISLPVSPQRHAFLILVSSKHNKIMISDWYVRKDGGIIGHKNDEEWKSYNSFMEFLKKTYPTYTAELFPIDKKIKTAAIKHHKDNKNSLGCSFYIYKWINQHQAELQ